MFHINYQMPRPRKKRRICNKLSVNYYKPQGLELNKLEEVELSDDEVEAMRLIDYKGLNMEEASREMNVSKSTICRTVNAGRHKIAKGIFKGHAIRISFNNINMPNFDGTGPEGKGPQTGRGYGKCKAAKNSPQPQPNFSARGKSFGRGRGFGSGRGSGRPKI